MRPSTTSISRIAIVVLLGAVFGPMTILTPHGNVTSTVSFQCTLGVKTHAAFGISVKNP